jgi:hypothetical protein
LGLTGEIKSLNLQVTEKTTIMDLIKMSVDIFNDNFVNENLKIRLKPHYRLYNMKPSKKSGKPDKDLPSKNKILYFYIFCYVFYFFVLLLPVQYYIIFNKVINLFKK